MPQMTHAQIIDLIANINRGITGINASYDSQHLPQALNVFPAAITLLSFDDYTKFGPTEYQVRVFVAPIQTGTTQTAYSQVLQLSTAFHDVYTHLRTIGDRYIYRGRLTAKAGFGNTGFAYTLKWGKSDYYGFSMNLPLASSSPGA